MHYHRGRGLLSVKARPFSKSKCLQQGEQHNKGGGESNFFHDRPYRSETLTREFLISGLPYLRRSQL